MSGMLVHRKVKWINSIVLLAGMYNQSLDIIHRPSMYKFLTNRVGLSEDDLYNRSIVNFVKELPNNIPILLLHGRLDDRVTPISSMEFGIKLQENNIPYKIVIYPEGDHSLKQHIGDLTIEITKWIQKYTTFQKQDGGSIENILNFIY